MSVDDFRMQQLKDLEEYEKAERRRTPSENDLRLQSNREALRQRGRELHYARIREVLPTDEFARLNAVAMFPLEVCVMAQSLHRLLECAQIAGEPLVGAPREAALLLERKIREAYRERFGTELGAA